MNVMHLRSSEFFGGPERAILGQCRTMTDVDFVCASFVREGQDNPFLEKAKEYGLKTEAIPESFAGDFRVVGKLKALIEKYKIDLIVSHDYKGNFFGRKAAARCKIAHIAHFRGITREDKKVRLYNYIDKATLRKLMCVLTVSRKSKAILEDLGVDGNKIKVVFNAVESSKLVDQTFTRTIDKSKPFVFVAAGRLSHEKGYDILLQACSQLKSSVNNFRVGIYGHGPEENHLKTMVEELGLAGVVEFKGFVDDVLPVLKNADALVLPSRSEGMPNIVLEAWSQKLAVVSTAVGGVPEMIVDSVGGLICQSEDPAALSEIMMQVVQKPDDAIGFGEEGYDLVKSQYTFDRQAEILRDIYHTQIERIKGIVK